jgi:glycosidase
MDWYTAEQGPGQASWFKPEDRWNRPNDGVSVEEQQQYPDSLLNAYRTAIQLRRANPGLTRGTFDLLAMESTTRGPWGFSRTEENDSIVALFNFSDESSEVTIDEFPFTSIDLIDLITGKEYPGAEEDKPYTLTLPGASAFLLTGGQ